MSGLRVYVVGEGLPKGKVNARVVLRNYGGGELMLSAVDGAGSIISNLAIFQEDGTIYMCRNVEPALGFDLGDDDKILTSERTS